MSNAFVLFLILLLVYAHCSRVLYPPQQLLVEYMESPVIGVDRFNPRFSWYSTPSERNQSQYAYQIQVSTDSGVLLGDTWDSKKVVSSQSNNIKYPKEAEDLLSDQSYFWKVRWWDGDTVSPWSKVARFDMAIKGRYEWEDSGASWITGGDLFRSTFTVKKTSVSVARLYIVGLGWYEARMNGLKVGDHVLGHFTTFRETILYDVYDVTDAIKDGENVIGVELGNGWYNEPLFSELLEASNRVSAFLSIKYKSGETIRVPTSTKWKVSKGPIIMDDVYAGEHYDARLEQTGWDDVGFNNSAWTYASASSTPLSKRGDMRALMMPPIRETQTFSALKVWQSPSNASVFIFDFGQTIAGYCSINIQCSRGRQIELFHSEFLSTNNDLTLQFDSERNNVLEVTKYICKGSGLEVYKPKFSSFGFRYVALVGYSGVPTRSTLTAYFLHTDLKQTGNIVFSEPILNDLQSASVYARLSNWLNVPTDCPQRERRGWMADSFLPLEANIKEFSMGAALTKWVHDIRDNQVFYNSTNNGSVPEVIPNADGLGRTPADPAWGAGYTFNLYYLYLYTGDLEIVNEMYDGVYKYVESLISQSDNKTGLLMDSFYGDWLGLEKGCCASSVLSSFYMLSELEIVAEFAEKLDKQKDASYLKKQASRVRSSWETFFNKTTMTYGHGWETEQIIALYKDLVPQESKDDLIQRTVSTITDDQSGHIQTGIHGTKWMFLELTNLGYTKVALDALLQDTYPSFAYMIKSGATTIWESWYAYKDNVLSRNHQALCSFTDWCYKALAGINLAEGSIGFDEIEFYPRVTEVKHRLTSVSSSIRTYKGEVASNWQIFSASESIPICAEAYFGDNLELACENGGYISDIQFADYGFPFGYCGNYQHGGCTGINITSIVSSACTGKAKCTVPVYVDLSIKPSTCKSDLLQWTELGMKTKLVVQATGCTMPIYKHSVTVPLSSTGRVWVPLIESYDVIREGGVIVWKDKQFVPGVLGVNSAVLQNGHVVFSIGSGNYDFALYLP